MSDPIEQHRALVAHYTQRLGLQRTRSPVRRLRLQIWRQRLSGVAFGVGLGDVAGKVFRIGHLGSLTDVMTLSGIATAEMCMVDLGLDIGLGSGVAAAQEYFRAAPKLSQKDAA